MPVRFGNWFAGPGLQTEAEDLEDAESRGELLKKVCGQISKIFDLITHWPAAESPSEII